MVGSSEGLDRHAAPASGENAEQHDPENMSGMREELRILLPGSQMLTGFLILLPFNQRFERIPRLDQWVYLASFVCSLTSLVLFTAPAAQHRLQRPLRRRVGFKNRANRLIVAGLATLSLALILATHLVVSEIITGLPRFVITALVALLLGVTWWLLPLVHRAYEAS